MTSSIKITSLTDIGANISTTSVVPVVDMSGVPETKKANLQIVGNLILNGANGSTFPPAAQAVLAQSVTNAAQPNITSVGTLSALNVSGNVTTGNLVAGNIVGTLTGSATTAGTVTSNAQPNITSVGTLTGLTVNGVTNLGPVGNVKIEGGSAGQILTTDGAGNLSWGPDANSSYGNADVANYLPTFTGELSAGNANLGNAVVANYFIGDGSLITGLPAGYSNNDVANYLPTFTGELSAGNANLGDTVTANFFTGTLTTGAQPNITSVGALTDLTMAGNIIPDANVTYDLGNSTNRWKDLYLSGNTIVLGDAILSANANAFIIQTPDGGNFVLEGNANTTFGNIVGVNLDGNVGNVLAGDGTWIAAGGGGSYGDSNVTTLLSNLGSNAITTTANVTAGFFVGDGSALSNVTVSVAGNIVGTSPNVTLTANTQSWTFDNTGNLTLPGNVLGIYLNNGAPAFGNLSALNLDGNSANVLLGNGVFAAPSFTLTGDGGNLSNIQGANVVGAVANANFASNVAVESVSDDFSYHLILSKGAGDKTLHVDSLDNLQFNPNSGTMTLTRVDADYVLADLSFANGYQASNVVGLGNIATLNINGNASSVLLGNGSFGAVPGLGNVGAANFDGNAGNVLYGNGAFAAAPSGSGGLPLSNGNSIINIATVDGNITLDANGNVFTFGTDSNLTLPNNGVIGNPANSSLDPINPGVSTIVFTPDANYSTQSLILDPTAPGHIHLRAPSGTANIDEPSANLYLGGELSSFEVPYSSSGAPNVYVHSNAHTWNFDNTGNLTIPGTSGGLIKTVANASIGIVAIDNGTDNPAQMMSWNANAINPNTIISAYQTNATIQTNVNGSINTWNFDGDGNLSVPGNILVSGSASPAPYISGFSSITTIDGANLAGVTFANGNITATNIGNVAATNYDGSSSNVLYGNGVFAALPAASVPVFVIANANITASVNTSYQIDSSVANANINFTLPDGNGLATGSFVKINPYDLVGGNFQYFAVTNGANSAGIQGLVAPLSANRPTTLVWGGSFWYYSN